MGSIFNLDNRFFRFMGRLGDLILLNLFWLLCCVPIVTIGASTTALYYTILKIVRKEEPSISRMFFRSFLQNLRQGILLTLFFLLAGVFLFADIRFSLSVGTMAGQLLLGIFFLLSLAFLMTLSYAFPVLAQFDNSLKNTLKNACLMSFTHFLYTLVILILNLLPFALFFMQPYFFMLGMPFWLFLGASGIAWLNSHLFVRVFDRYIGL